MPYKRGEILKPSVANWEARLNSKLHSNKPWSSWASDNMANTPGTPVDKPLFLASRKPIGLLSASKNISAVAAAGAVSRPSNTEIAFSEASKCTINPPPANPELCGSTKLSTASIAMAASTAEPPALNISNPASVAWGLAVTTITGDGFTAVGVFSLADAVRLAKINRHKKRYGCIRCDLL